MEHGVVLYFFGGSLRLLKRLRFVLLYLGADMQQLADWLEGLGLGEYSQLFAENGIELGPSPT